MSAARVTRCLLEGRAHARFLLFTYLTACSAVILPSWVQPGINPSSRTCGTAIAIEVINTRITPSPKLTQLTQHKKFVAMLHAMFDCTGVLVGTGAGFAQNTGL